MKKTLLALSIAATLAACGSDNDNNNGPIGFTPNPDTAPQFFVMVTEGEGENAVETKVAAPEVFVAEANKDVTQEFTGRYIVEDASPGESLFISKTLVNQRTALDADGNTIVDQAGNPVLSAYGELKITSAGDWTYTLHRGNDDSDTPEHPDITNLVKADPSGATDLTDSFTVTTADGTEKQFVVTIKGIDEDSVFTGADQGLTLDAPMLKDKATSVKDANPEEAEFLSLYDHNGMVDGATPVDLAALAESGGEGSIDTLYGKLTFKVSKSEPAVKAVDEIKDENGNVIQEAVKGVAAKAAKVTWSYELDQERQAVKDLYDPASESYLYYSEALADDAVAPSVEDSFTLLSKGVIGNEQKVTITISGTQLEPAVFSEYPGQVIGEGEGAFSYPAAEVNLNDGIIATDIVVADVNYQQAALIPLTDSTEGLNYGSLTVTEAGRWTYLLDYNNSDVLALKYTGDVAPEPLTETVTLTSVDGSQVSFPVTILPVKQEVAVISAMPMVDPDTNVSGSSVKIDRKEVTGQLKIVDTNVWEASFQPINGAGTYGVFNMDTEGNWSYTLNEATAGLIKDGTLKVPHTEMIEVTSMDGSTTVIVPITIIDEPDDTAASVNAVAGDLGRVVFNIPAEAQLTGKMTFKMHYSVSKDSRIMLQGDDVIENNDFDRALIGMTIRNNGEARLYDGQGSYKSLDTKQNYQGWTTYELTWDATNATDTVAPDVSLVINDKKAALGTDFPVYDDADDMDYPSYARVLSKVKNGAKYFTLRSNSGSGVSGAMVVDDLVIYSDVKGENEVYRQTFDKLGVGGDITSLTDLIHDRTHGVTIELTTTGKPK